MAQIFSVSRSQLFAVLLLVPGCQCGQPNGTDDSGKVTTTPTTTLSDAVLVEHGVQVCQAPTARQNGNFERRQSPALATSASRLWGGGAILGDFKGDGTLQMVLTGETTLQFWSAVPGATPEDFEFEEEAAERFLSDPFPYTVGGTAIDYDGDGDLDLFLTRWNLGNLLLENDGTGQFTNATPPAFKANQYRSQSGSWGDFDGDGDLDLFVGNYGAKPDTYDDANMPPADPAELYENLGNGNFADITDKLPTEAKDGYTFSSGWYDLDGDQQPELIIANDFGKVRPSVLLRYQDGSFVADTTFHPTWEDMGMGVADLNGDEVPDFLMSSWKTMSFLQSGDAFNENLKGSWVDSSGAAGMVVDYTENRNQVYGWGADFADFDNDADLDALVLFGFWSAYPGDNDPFNQVDGLWEQVSPGNFEDRAGEPEWLVNDSGHGRGFATGDLNQDGYIDIIKREVGAASPLYLSRCGDKTWVRVHLDAPAPNTFAIGAKVAVEVDGVRQIRWITAGSTGMYSGQPPEAHFGLNDADTLDKLEITWPDGTKSVFKDVPTRQRLTVQRSADR